MRPSAGPDPLGTSDRRAELDLFRLTARSALTAEAEGQLGRVLDETLDWGYVLSRGGLHGILPLLHVHLGRRDSVPASVRVALRERSERVARSNLHLSARLIEIVGALENAGVSVLVLKGPAAALTLYGSLLLREFGDLDILVKHAEVPEAIAAVEALGFVPWRETSGAQEDLLTHLEYSRTFTRPTDDLDLDMHWDLARSFFRGRIEAEALWTEPQSFQLHGRELHSLSPELLLPALCVHGAKHGPFPWPRLKWIVDVAEFVRRSEAFDWDNELDRARSLGCYRTMLFGLEVARPLLDDGLPRRLEGELETQPGLRSAAERIWEWLGSEWPVSLSFSERAALDLALIDGGAGRVSYAVRRTFTPTQKDWAGRSLPRRLGFLYVPLRMARLAGQYLPAPWRLRRLLKAKGPRSDPDQAS